MSCYDNDVTTLLSIFVLCYFTEWFYNLPCEYNFQLDESMWQKGLEAIFPAYHNCTKIPKIYHGNGGTDIPQEDENGQLRLWKQNRFSSKLVSQQNKRHLKEKKQGKRHAGKPLLKTWQVLETLVEHFCKTKMLERNLKKILLFPNRTFYNRAATNANNQLWRKTI